ncbi:hypothetical protein IE81DRAFT_117836 [Ceraceosorus guamensis]|uniref:Uncharacterized protein n=1 Tax=Ceraceosorus guamensis TaxID=1522189 RepID=A0A316W284_9BASI|nr:hypothetical protein IE81DRAFT_117836 [Ceraceosorus guamensis]PWN42671.1 hypothetical protein IE81DRAFT_117836 [Ceraceosorus guamensis]
MSAEVANPADTLGPRINTSRRSILASMEAESAEAEASPVPVSNTDALLRQRRPSSSQSRSNGVTGTKEADSKSHRRKSSVSSKKSPVPATSFGSGSDKDAQLDVPKSSLNIARCLLGARAKATCMHTAWRADDVLDTLALEAHHRLRESGLRRSQTS